MIDVKFETRDGHLHATSEQVPGLYLCGPNPQDVIDDVIPAIKALFKLNRGWNVEVVPETEASQFLAQVMSRSRKSSCQWRIRILY